MVHGPEGIIARGYVDVQAGKGPGMFGRTKP